VRFGDVLRRVPRPVDPIDDVTYQLVNAKRSRGGIVPRTRLAGCDILVKNQYGICTGDFLISHRQIIHGACGLVPEALDGALVSNEYSALRPTDDLLPEYLAYLSHTSYFQRTCFHSSVGVDVEKMVFDIDKWLQYSLPVPLVEHQREAVAILNTIDRAVATTGAAAKQARAAMLALAQDLLGRGVPGRHTTWKVTEWGEAPANWDITSLEHAGEWLSGGTPSKARADLWSGEVPWVSPKDMKRFRLSDATDHVSEAALGSGTRLAPAGSVLMVVRGMILAHSFPVAIASRPLAFNQDIKVVVPVASLDPAFLMYWLMLREPDVLDLTSDSTHGTKRVPTEDLLALGIPVPPMPEQLEIVAALDACDDAAKAYEQEGIQLQKVRRAMLEDVMWGRIGRSTAAELP
jgi:type I restriction enzyme S subunit